LSRREAAGQQVRGLLALGPGQAQVVARHGADVPDRQLDEHDKAEPDHDDHDRVVGAQTTKPVQDAGHVDNLSPDPEPADTLEVRGSRQANHRFIVAVNLVTFG
jgi:hypothetical protein